MGRKKWVFGFLVALMAASLYSAQQYINDVVSGKQVACKYVKLAVDRHLRDIERQRAADFPYYFDDAQARRVIDFKRQLRHYQGPLAGKSFDPLPHQQFKDWVLFGWRSLDGTRRFRKAYIEEARKNGKTFDAASTGVYCFYADNPQDKGVQVYCVATNKEQAHVAFDAITSLVQLQPTLNRVSRLWKGGMKGKFRHVTSLVDPASYITLWSADSKTKDGFWPSVAICDEMHAWKDNTMLEVITSGQIGRPQPLDYIITTAGVDQSSPCFQEERTLAVAILEQTIQPADETTFALIYTLDEGDDFTDPKVWIKANPSMGVAFPESDIAARVKDALSTPSKRNLILTKNFNTWTQAATRWITPEAWADCGREFDPEILAGRRCYAGLDLSTVIDLTAYALVFPPLDADQVYRFLWRFFVPGDDLIDRERRDKVPYIEWVRRGLITTTPGNVIDYDFIEQRFIEDAKTFEIKEIAFDPWKAQEIVNHLTEGGLTMVPIQQRYSGMAAPTEQFERLVLTKQIAHGGNPVMTWMISCTDVKSDRQGNIMPMKPERNKSGKRIDGVVAAIMALDRAMRHDSGTSVYEQRGVAAI